MDDPYSPFTPGSTHRMLAFLPFFERGMFKTANEHYLQTGQNTPHVDRLVAEIYDSGFALPFDWTNWNAESALARLEHADLQALRKLLTAFARGDRMSGGTLAALCADGTIERVLRRLKTLAETKTAAR